MATMGGGKTDGGISQPTSDPVNNSDPDLAAQQQANVAEPRFAASNGHQQPDVVIIPDPVEEPQAPTPPEEPEDPASPDGGHQDPTPPEEPQDPTPPEEPQDPTPPEEPQDPTPPPPTGGHQQPAPPEEPQDPTPPEEPQEPTPPAGGHQDPDPTDPDPTPPTDPDPTDPDPTPPTDPDPTDPSTNVPLDADFTASALSGRVTTLELPGDDVTGIKILSGPQYGNVTVNPDNTLAVVLTGTTDTGNLNFTVETTASDGSTSTQTVGLDVTAGPQSGGWGLGEFYMLETDENDDVVVEYGENHREVYVSGDSNALTLADIAAIEGISVNQIKGSFFANNPEYGASEGMALAEDAGMKLWGSITGRGTEPSSNWLLLERGYEYDNLGTFIKDGTKGESEINPIYVGAYGEGEQPVVTEQLKMIKLAGENVVIQGISFTDGITALGGSNYLFDDLSFTEAETNIQNVEGFTLRNSDIIDVANQNPSNGTVWKAFNDRESGLYMAKSSGILLENNFIDRNGWSEDYSPDGSPDGGQPPTQFSHNIYLQGNNLDVTFRDNIVMRGASTGLQFRPGGYVEDNVFLDNNGGILIGGGGREDLGNYSLVNGNIVTSGAHKEADEGQGALTQGMSNNGEMATLIDNIIANLADPNNPDELADKEKGQFALQSRGELYYNDTIIYNWVGANNAGQEDEINANVGGLSEATLDQTTIQLYTAQLLGQETATISDLADYLRAQANGQLDNVVDADLIIEFFQTGYGISTDLRAEAETLRFVPNDLGDGVRWDNRLNWTTDDLPGTQDGDSVDLAGNWVVYGGTTRIEDLDFGDGGQLDVNYGYLQVNDYITVGDTGAELNIDSSGQFWTNGYTDSDLLTINAAGGRFANTDLFTGTTALNISDNAQAILATDGADFVLNQDSSITITGDDVKVGFDGENGGTGVLLMADNSTLGFVAEDGELGEIREFYSGAFDTGGPDIQSGVNLGNANLFLDLSGVAGGDAVDETLIRVDEVIGNFEDIEIVGLGTNQDAFVTVDYEADTVTLSLGAAGQGSGRVTLGTAGDETDAQDNDDLWAALTNGHGIYPDDPLADIPEEEDDSIDA